MARCSTIALVEALEARGEQRQLSLHGELLDHPLVERPSLRRQRDHPAPGLAAVRGVERRGDDVDAEDHAGAAAVRLVVDLAAAKRRRVAVGEQAQVELTAENGRRRVAVR